MGASYTARRLWREPPRGPARRRAEWGTVGDVTQLYELGALEFSRLLSRGELTSEALVEALWARTDAVDGRIGAYAIRLRDASLRDARALDAERAAGRVRGPLHGVPVTIKENVGVAGTDWTAGLSARRGQPADEDAVVVRLLRAAGAIVLGKGNVPQTLMAAETTNTVYGTTKNPWNTERVPGGSSGGEAALLASGQTPLAVGTDVGGSIRIPAAFSGVVGLKPTLGRWSNVGSHAVLRGQPVVRAQIGPMARSVADVEFLLGAADPLEQAAFDPEVPPVALSPSSRVVLDGLRVGVYEDDGFLTPSDSVRRAVREAAEHLRAAGAEVVEYRPRDPAETYLLGVASFTSDGMQHARAALQGEPVIAPLRLFERTSGLPRAARAAIARALEAVGERRLARALAASAAKSASELWDLAADRLVRARLELEDWSRAGVQALLCPAFATPAPQHGATGDFAAGAAYTIRYNVLNLPAGVVPVTRVRADESRGDGPKADRVEKRARDIDRGSEGLPVGVQLVGRPYREDVVLALMAAVESGARARETFPRTPIDPR
jgi:fatty acid amide hydrolase